MRFMYNAIILDLIEMKLYMYTYEKTMIFNKSSNQFKSVSIDFRCLEENDGKIKCNIINIVLEFNVFPLQYT